jgi:hypothetical protein
LHTVSANNIVETPCSDSADELHSDTLGKNDHKTQETHEISNEDIVSHVITSEFKNNTNK